MSGKKDRKSLTTSEVKVEEFLSDLYGYCMSSEFELKELYDLHKYQGFSRDDILKELFGTFVDKKVVGEIVLICALNGPVKASEKKCESTGRTLNSMGIPSSKKPGTKGLSCGRIAASTADLAAHFLKRMNHPKRMMIDLPGWLQFPTAAAIKLPENFRDAHRSYAKKFSESLPSGSFNADIYLQMELNAYLDPRLGLF